MALFSNNNNGNKVFTYTNINEVVHTSWTPVKMKVVDKETGDVHYEDEPMIPFMQFSRNAESVIDCEVIFGEHDSALVKFTTRYNGEFKYPIHRDCDYSIGDHIKKEDILVMRLVRGEAAKYTAETLTPKIFNEQVKLGNVCFKLMW